MCQNSSNFYWERNTPIQKLLTCNSSPKPFQRLSVCVCLNCIICHKFIMKSRWEEHNIEFKRKKNGEKKYKWHVHKQLESRILTIQLIWKLYAFPRFVYKWTHPNMIWMRTVHSACTRLYPVAGFASNTCDSQYIEIMP